MGLFGTDGIRGIANEELTPELAYRVGFAGGVFLRSRRPQGVARPSVLVGRDTRLSGDMLSTAVSAGLMAAGCDVWNLDVAPTPTVAFLTRDSHAVGGVVISASHNPWPYNGIKFFSHTGAKLLKAEEAQIEQLIDDAAVGTLPGVAPGEVGTMRWAPELLQDYRKALVQLVQAELAMDRPFSDLRVVIDCANGASTVTAPAVLQELGAEVVALGVQPDGININEGLGSLHPDVVAEHVVANGATVGLAFDGDADRVIATTEGGDVVNGDRIMALCGRDLAQRGRLRNDVLVTTVMSNMALDLLLARDGVGVSRTPVGDREVFVRMRELGAVLGGEQSGHIIFSEYNQTGDGLLTGLNLLMAMHRSGRPLGELTADFQPLPQKLVNVEVQDKATVTEAPGVREAVARVEEALRGRGRVLVRPSGTEPVIRVMVEGPDAEELEQLADQVVSAVREV